MSLTDRDLTLLNSALQAFINWTNQPNRTLQRSTERILRRALANQPDDRIVKLISLLNETITSDQFPRSRWFDFASLYLMKSGNTSSPHGLRETVQQDTVRQTVKSKPTQSPPSHVDTIRSASSDTLSFPVVELTPEILRLRMVAAIDQSGLTRQQIGVAMGFKPTAAKQGINQLVNVTPNPGIFSLIRFAKVVQVPLHVLIGEIPVPEKKSPKSGK